MNRTIVITGASSGLGLSLAKKFLNENDHVFGISKTKENWKDAFLKTNGNKRFSLKQLDATKEILVQKYLKSVVLLSGKIDILINNAGFGGKLSHIEDTNTEEVLKHFKQNLLSAFFFCKYTIPILTKQRNGLIINISSYAGKRAVPELAAYSISKFGIVALSQCIAKENLNTGLKCITVCPGGMNTQMRAQIFGSEDAKKQQSTEYVASVIHQIVSGQIQVDSGGDIVIRQGKISAINPAPAA